MYTLADELALYGVGLLTIQSPGFTIYVYVHEQGLRHFRENGITCIVKGLRQHYPSKHLA